MVFIVDDGADYRFLLQQVFGRFLPQYPVRFFADGDDLRRHVLTGGERPRVILLDLDMPILNGQQTLRFLKQQPVWNRIPVVIMTSSADAGDMETCYEAGASSLLIKPSDFEQMRQNLGLICQYWLTMNRLPDRQPVSRT